MPHLPVELQVFAQRHDRPVDTSPQKALLEQIIEEVAVLPFLPVDDGSQHEEPGLGRQLPQAVEDLIAGLRRNRPVAFRAVSRSDPGEEHPQVIVNFGNRTDRAARIAAAGLLLDRNRRRKPGDRIDFRLGHLSEKLAGVARQRLDVAALTLGVQRVEGERALA